MFLKTTQLQGPKPTSQYVTVSMRIGMISPRREKQKAPMRPMNGPIVGTATASNTKHRVNLFTMSIKSEINFGIRLYGATTKLKLDKILNLQKKGICIILNLNRNDSVKEQ